MFTLPYKTQTQSKRKKSQTCQNIEQAYGPSIYIYILKKRKKMQSATKDNRWITESFDTYIMCGGSTLQIIPTPQKLESVVAIQQKYRL